MAIRHPDIPSNYTEENRNEYWQAHWKVGDEALGWKKAERARGEPLLVKHILDGLNVTDKFPDFKSNTKSVTENSDFFESHIRGANAFVPLCGDSRVVSLLAEMGFSVVGCDLSMDALKNIVSEIKNNTAPDTFSWKELTKEECEAKGCESGIFGLHSTRQNVVQLLAGDFFKLNLPSEQFDVIYDRGSLVALLPEMRERYLDKVRPSMKKNNNSSVKLFQNVSVDDANNKDKKIVGLWLFVRAVHNEKTRKGGPPFHFGLEDDVKGKYFTKEHGFEIVRPIDNPSEEDVENAPNGAFVEAMTQIYRLA